MRSTGDHSSVITYMDHYTCTTQVPNALFDQWMKELSLSELKLLLLVNRQTLGWVDGKSGRRKTRDWLSCSRIEVKTGLSKRAISTATEALVKRGLLVVSDKKGNILTDADARRGRIRLYYALGYPHESHKCVARSAKGAEVDQQSLPTTKPIHTKPTLFTTAYGRGKRRTTKTPDAPAFSGLISELLPSVVPSELWERIHQSETAGESPP